MVDLSKYSQAEIEAMLSGQAPLPEPDAPEPVDIITPDDLPGSTELPLAESPPTEQLRTLDTAPPTLPTPPPEPESKLVTERLDVGESTLVRAEEERGMDIPASSIVADLPPEPKFSMADVALPEPIPELELQPTTEIEMVETTVPEAIPELELEPEPEPEVAEEPTSRIVADFTEPAITDVPDIEAIEGLSPFQREIALSGAEELPTREQLTVGVVSYGEYDVGKTGLLATEDTGGPTVKVYDAVGKVVDVPRETWQDISSKQGMGRVREEALAQAGLIEKTVVREPVYAGRIATEDYDPSVAESEQSRVFYTIDVFDYKGDRITMTPYDYQRLFFDATLTMPSTPKQQFDKFKGAGLIPSGSIFIETADGWSYQLPKLDIPIGLDTSVSTTRTGDDKQLATGEFVSLAQFNKLENENPAAANALLIGGFVGLNAEIERQQRDFVANNFQLKTGEYVSISEFENLKAQNPKAADALLIGGFEALNEEVGRQQRLFDASNVELATGEYVSRLSMNDLRKQDSELADILFNGGFAAFNAEVDKRKAEFNQRYGPTELETWWDKVKERGGVGLDALQFVQFLKDNPDLGSVPAPQVGTRQEYPEPDISLDAFISQYQSTRGIEPTGAFGLTKTNEQRESKDYAIIKYAELFGPDALGKGVGVEVASLVPAARALKPEVTIKEITPIDWGVSAAQVLLLGAPIISRPLSAVGISGRAVTTGVGLASGGVFTASTIKEWENLTPVQRGISVALDTLILGSGLAGAVPALAKRTTPVIKTSANYISNAVKDAVAVAPKAIKSINLSNAMTGIINNQIRFGSFGPTVVLKEANTLFKTYNVKPPTTLGKRIKTAVSKVTVARDKLIQNSVNKALGEVEVKPLTIRTATNEQINAAFTTARRVLNIQGSEIAALPTAQKSILFRLNTSQLRNLAKRIKTNTQRGINNAIRRSVDKAISEADLKPLKISTVTQSEVDRAFVVANRVLRAKGLDLGVLTAGKKASLLKLTTAQLNKTINIIKSKLSTGISRATSNATSKALEGVEVKPYNVISQADVDRAFAVANRVIRAKGFTIQISNLTQAQRASLLRLTKTQLKRVIDSIVRNVTAWINKTINNAVAKAIEQSELKAMKPKPTVTQAQVDAAFRSANAVLKAQGIEIKVTQAQRASILNMTRQQLRNFINSVTKQMRVWRQKTVSEAIKSSELKPLTVEPTAAQRQAFRTAESVLKSQGIDLGVITPKQRTSILQMSKQQITRFKNNVIKQFNEGISKSIKDAGIERTFDIPLERPLNMTNVLQELNLALSSGNRMGLIRAARRLETLGKNIPKSAGGDEIIRRARQMINNPNAFLRYSKNPPPQKNVEPSIKALENQAGELKDVDAAVSALRRKPRVDVRDAVKEKTQQEINQLQRERAAQWNKRDNVVTKTIERSKVTPKKEAPKISKISRVKGSYIPTVAIPSVVFQGIPSVTKVDVTRVPLEFVAPSIRAGEDVDVERVPLRIRRVSDLPEESGVTTLDPATIPVEVLKPSEKVVPVEEVEAIDKTKIKQEEIAKVSIVPEPVPIPAPKPFPFEATVVSVDTTKPKPIQPLKPIIKVGKKVITEPKKKYRPGTVVLIQGRPDGGAMYKISEPPYNPENVITTREKPEGYVDQGFTGKGSAFKSIQVIGGPLTKPIKGIDLGVVRININLVNGKPVIDYDKDTDANAGDKSRTVGMGKGQIPIAAWKEAKEKGISFEDFVNQYRGEKVGDVEYTYLPDEMPPELKVIRTESDVILEPERKIVKVKKFVSRNSKPVEKQALERIIKGTRG